MAWNKKPAEEKGPVENVDHEFKLVHSFVTQLDKSHLMVKFRGELGTLEGKLRTTNEALFEPDATYKITITKV